MTTPSFRCLISLSYAFFSIICNQAFADIKVVVTIKPLHSLVAGITDGVLSPDLLIQKNSSPHQASLRPSNVVKIDSADLIITVHPNFSGLMSTAINNVRHRTKVVTLSELPNIHSLPARTIRKEGNEASHRGHSHKSVDPHFWLDISNMQIFVVQVTKIFTELDPDNSAAYLANHNRLLDQLETLDQSIKNKMDRLNSKSVKILLFHDAYQYFENRYNMHIEEFVTASPEHRPGTKHLSNLQQKIAAGGITCALSEPQFSSRIFDNILAKGQIKKGVIDPLGSQLEPGKKAYFQLMEALAESFYNCLP